MQTLGFARLRRASGILAAFFLALPLLAQTNLAVLRGTIRDPQSRTVQGVTIRLTAAETGAHRTTLSDGSGWFEVSGLAPGEYKVEISAPGFTLSSTSVKLEVGQQMSLDLQLELGERAETVNVAGHAELLKTADASLGEVVESKSIQDLPLNGRMLLDLAVTVPGAHVGHGAQAGNMNPLYWRPGQPSALSIGGNRPNANYFLVDGVINTDPTFNTQNISLSPDAVREFQVQTGSYSAEMGGAGGGQINIATRSGTSELHGTLYEYLRNNAFDARTFNEMPGDTHQVRNNFGAALGGPIAGKKTFFFLNYERMQHVMADTALDTVPTPQEVGGDFSGSGTTIYDPATSLANPNYNPSQPVSGTNPKTLRTQFPNNVIPGSRISSVASIFLQNYVPQPNTMGGVGMNMIMNMGLGAGGAMGTPSVFGAGTDANNYMDVRDEWHRDSQGTARVDRVFDNGDSLFGRYSVSSELGFTPQNLPGFGAYNDNMAQNGNITWNHLISPAVLNSASVAVSRLTMHRYSENNNSNNIVQQLGIQGVGFGGAGAYGAPYFNVQGYSGMGDSFLATPMHAYDTVLEARDTLDWQRGSHSLKVGGSFRWYIWPMWGFFQNRGYYQFTNGFTTQSLTNDGTGSGMASYLLGLPSVRQAQAGIPSMNLRHAGLDAFVEDTWRVTAHTTLEYGVRYEFMSALTDTVRDWANLTVQNGQLVAFVGGQNGMPRGLTHPNKLDFAPRFGVSHQFGNGFVWRSSYGIFYTPVDLNTWCNQLHNVPLVFPITQQSDNFTPSLTGFNFPSPVLGKTTTSFNAFELNPKPQYVQQWSASLQKSLGPATVLEAGYHGERGYHLQQADLINNAPPGPGLIQPRRPYQTATFVPGTVFPSADTVVSSTVPLSSINLLQNSARSWYDGGYINVRRRYSNRLSLLANYTYAKALTTAPDFRSPMFESSVPQNDSDLNAEKGPGCDIRHRVALSAVYAIPGWKRDRLTSRVTANWQLATLFQIQSGYPFTISVFGDTANAGTVLGENPIRANYSGLPLYPSGTHTAQEWFNTAAFLVPPAYTFGNVGRNTVYGPGLETTDLSLSREFAIAERVRFSIRGEAFNALNHTNLGTPNRFVNTPQFGTITDAATPGREIQLGARLSF